MQIFANGQLGTAAATIYQQGKPPSGAISPQPQGWGTACALSFQNTSGSISQTLLVFVQNTSNGSTTNRRIGRAVLAANEQYLLSGVTLGYGDIIQAQTTTASVVDYIVSEATPGPFQAQVLDSSGQLKSAINPSLTTATTITSASAAAFAVGPNGATNPVFQIDDSTSSQADGVKLTGLAAGSGATLVVTTSGTNAPLNINAVGSGNVVMNQAGTGLTTFTQGLTSSKGILSIAPTGVGVGYATGAGGAVTQGTNRTTGVTLSKLTGAITLFSAAGSATPATFTVTNTTVAALDTIVMTQKTGSTDVYSATAVAGSGSFTVTIIDLTGTTTEAPVFNFAVFKAVAS